MRRFLWFAAAVLVIGPAFASAAEAPTLSADDRTLLEKWVGELLFDPVGAERVVVPLSARCPWLPNATLELACWLRRDDAGKPHELFFVDRRPVPAPPDGLIKKVDFVAECRKRYSVFDDVDDNARDNRLSELRRSGHEIDQCDAACAAWLHRLGHDDLAARALAIARRHYRDVEDELRADLTWFAYETVIDAFAARADDEAVAAGKHFMKTYPGESVENEQVESILADLERRRAKGTFGKAPPDDWPEGFKTWDIARKIRFLVEALDEAGYHHFYFEPTDKPDDFDRRVGALVEIGEPAIPALLDVLEHDHRLTRAQTAFSYKFPRARYVKDVKSPALFAITAILRVEQWDTPSRGKPFEYRRWEDYEQALRQLRTYWATYGKLPFEERMMSILTDPRTTFPAKREAAANLTDAHMHQNGDTLFIPRDRAKKPNPAVAKLSNPTFAEAIVAAYDAEQAAAPDIDELDNEQYVANVEYLAVLKELGDQRIAGECARRSRSAASSAERRNWAFVAQQLGDSERLDRLADAFRQGVLHLPPREPDYDGYWDARHYELAAFVDAFVAARTTATERALAAATEPGHSYYRDVEPMAYGGTIDYWNREAGVAVHPFYLALLRRALDDVTPTATTYEVEGDRLAVRATKTSNPSFSPLPDELADPKLRRPRVEARQCDLAAERLNELIVGFPRCFPLFRDTDERLARLRAEFDRFSKRYRYVTEAEAEALGVWGAVFLPDVRRLGRAATAADVAAGMAIFHLDGRGKPADLKLPAIAELIETDKDGSPRHGLILQAEVDSNGRKVYGIVELHDIRTLRDDEFKAVQTEAEFAAAQQAENERRLREAQRNGGGGTF